MHKREFLKAGAGLALAAVSVSGKAATPGVMTREDYLRYVTLFNANDPAFIEYYAPDVVFEVGTTTMQGATTIRDFYANVKQYIKEEVEVTMFVADENTVAPEVSAETSLREQALRDLLDQLSYRERRVLELRYGLRGEKPRTLDELGRMFNVTRERIRQVESQSLQKLGSLPDSGRLG